MKKIKLLFFALSVVTTPLFVSCGNDDDENPCEEYAVLREKMDRYEAELESLDAKLKANKITDIQYKIELADLNKKYDYASLSIELELKEAVCDMVTSK